MTKIENLKIKNFRSIDLIELDLSDVTVLIGPNNAGKSNVLKALDWVLAPKSLLLDDFRDRNKPVSVDFELSGIIEEILSTLESKHKAAISPFVQNEKLFLRREQPTPEAKAAEIKLTIRDNLGNYKPAPTGIPAALKNLFPVPIYIGAMEKVSDDVGQAKQNNTIGQLVSALLEPLQASKGRKIERRLALLSKMLSSDGTHRAQELIDFDTDATGHLDAFFPGLEISVDLPVPKLAELFKAGKIKITEHGNGRELQSFGHGAQRSVQMALVRMLAESKATDDCSVAGTLLLIDEPELYLHPQAIEQVRSALADLTCKGFQVAYSTHSPLMLDPEQVIDAIILDKTIANGTTNRQTIRNVVSEAIHGAQSQAEILFSLQNLSQILFCDRVILTEGKTERALLPFSYKNINAQSLGADRIALVCMDGAKSIPKASIVLKAFGSKVKEVYDLDFAFTNELLPKTDVDISHCLDHLQILSSTGKVTLGENHLPTKANGVSASDAFALMATECPIQVNNIHTKLREKNIWIWSEGDIEKHFGLSGKTSADHAMFISTAKTSGIESNVNNYQSIVDFCSWAKDPW